MNLGFRPHLMCVACGLTVVSLLTPDAAARPHYSDCSVKMDVPTSVAIGTFRTPEFPVKRKGYRILLRVESRGRSPKEMICLLGTDWSNLGIKCDGDPKVQGNWIVWNGAKQVAQGAVSGGGGHGETPDERVLGYFTAAAKGNYTVEMRFTKDGGPLKDMDVHLVIRQEYDFWCTPA